MRNVGHRTDLQWLIPAIIALAALTGCAGTGRHISVVSPGQIGNARDFDVDNMDRYKDAACAYRIGVGEKVAGTPAGPLVCNIGTAAALATADHAMLFRNQIADDLRKNIDKVYNEYVQVLYTGKGVEGLTTDIANLGLTAASTITLVTRTKTILSALATAVAGVGLSVDKNVFGQQTFAALASAMQARRDQARKTILDNELRGVDVYSLDQALVYLVAYFYSGTLPGALEEIQEEAALKSAAATGGVGVGTAAKLAFLGPPATAATNAPVAVEVQVEDSSGALVAGATNSITLTPTPSAGVSGTLTQAAAGGVAVFYLTFANPGSYTLAAAASGLQGVTSSQIQVNAAPGALDAAALAFVKPSASAALPGSPNTPVTVLVQVVDSNGVRVAGSDAFVAIASSPTGVTNSSGSLTVQAINGVATFSLSFAAANSYTLTATSPPLISASGLSVSIAAPAPRALPLTTTGIH